MNLPSRVGLDPAIPCASHAREARAQRFSRARGGEGKKDGMDEIAYEKKRAEKRAREEAEVARRLTNEQLADALIEAEQIKNWRQLNVLQMEFERRWGVIA